MEKNTEQKNNILHVGLDVGSTTVKIIVMDSNLNTIYEDYQRHFSDTKNTVCNVLENLIKKYPENAFNNSIKKGSWSNVCKQISRRRIYTRSCIL